jgi:hypothetical protein
VAIASNGLGQGIDTMEYYTVRDAFEGMIGEFDSRHEALETAESCGIACTVFAFDCLAIASFEKGGFRNA